MHNHTGYSSRTCLYKRLVLLKWSHQNNRMNIHKTMQWNGTLYLSVVVTLLVKMQTRVEV